MIKCPYYVNSKCLCGLDASNTFCQGYLSKTTGLVINNTLLPSDHYMCPINSDVIGNLADIQLLNDIHKRMGLIDDLESKLSDED